VADAVEFDDSRISGQAESLSEMRRQLLLQQQHKNLPCEGAVQDSPFANVAHR
jgi:hypothetical protein